MRTLIIALATTLAAAAPALADEKPANPVIDRAQLREALVKQRKLHLQRFHAYRLKKIYPHNTYDPGMKNVWLDRDGHLCAVATLMKADGFEAVVEQTGKTDNFVRVAELTEGPLVDWVLTSGFTQEEVVMIQQPSEADVRQYEQEQRARERRAARAQAREDNRLAGNYRATEQALGQSTMATAGLDLAVERLMQHPQLAAALLAQN